MESNNTPLKLAKNKKYTKAKEEDERTSNIVKEASRNVVAKQIAMHLAEVAASSVVNQYFSDHFPTMITCMDLGFHQVPLKSFSLKPINVLILEPEEAVKRKD